jgi:hypothetical protein
LCDITSIEANNNKANAITIVQSIAGADFRDDEKYNAKFIKDAVVQEFKQAFQLLEKTKLPVCFIRHIPHYDEGFFGTAAQHFMFLYFFYDYDNKKSVLVADPQGSKFGDRNTSQGEKAIDVQAVDIIGSAAKENRAEIYVSKDEIQQDNGACGPVSTELARAFYEISGNKNKKEELFRVLRESKREQVDIIGYVQNAWIKEIDVSEGRKERPKIYASQDEMQQYGCNRSMLQYQVCMLGSSIIPKKIIDDFKVLSG